MIGTHLLAHARSRAVRTLGRCLVRPRSCADLAGFEFSEIDCVTQCENETLGRGFADLPKSVRTIRVHNLFDLIVYTFFVACIESRIGYSCLPSRYRSQAYPVRLELFAGNTLGHIMTSSYLSFAAALSQCMSTLTCSGRDGPPRQHHHSQRFEGTHAFFVVHIRLR